MIIWNFISDIHLEELAIKGLSCQKRDLLGHLPITGSASASRGLSRVGRGRSTGTERSIELSSGKLNSGPLGSGSRVSKVSGDTARAGTDVVPSCREGTHV
jgi:hypothetical protein